MAAVGAKAKKAKSWYVWDVVPASSLYCMRCHSPFLELVQKDPTGRVVYHAAPLACLKCATARELADAVKAIYSYVKGSRDRARLVKRARCARKVAAGRSSTNWRSRGGCWSGLSEHTTRSKTAQGDAARICKGIVLYIAGLITSATLEVLADAGAAR